VLGEFLKTLLIIWGISAIVIFALQRVRVSPIIGFLIAGVIIGPNGFKLIRSSEVVEVLAEIGVVLLLFTIGIELSVKELIRLRKHFLVGGSIQVILTVLLASFLTYLVIREINKSIFVGFLIALSSTAILFKILADRSEVDSPHGRIMTAILIFQDLCVVPMILITPLLGGGSVDIRSAVIQLMKAIIIIMIVLLMAKWVVPILLYKLVKSGIRELFIISIILLCFGVAYLTSLVGLSLALGAFLAGLIISESEYSHQATSDILPFKESFTGLFFVSVGMLLDVSYVIKNYWVVIIVSLAIFLLKSVVGMVAACIAGTHIKPSIHAGIGLGQIGEFSFVVAIAGRKLGIIDDNFYQLFISSSILTMIATPFLMNVAPDVAHWLVKKGLIREGKSRLKKVDKYGSEAVRIREHVIIVGFGLVGRNLALVLKEVNIPYVVLELNIDTVMKMKEKGEPIYYGDGTSKDILRKLGIKRANLLVIAISDPAATRRMVSIARNENKKLNIIVRTRYLAEVDELKNLGANDVIPEEYETSIEIFSRVLSAYKFPNHIILDLVEKVRGGNYYALRGTELPRKYLLKDIDLIPDIEVDSFRVSGESFLVGKSIDELQIRKKINVTILAIKRGERVIINPSPLLKFDYDDVIIYAGEHSAMHRALFYFKGDNQLNNQNELSEE